MSKYSCSKFSDNVAEYLYALTMESGQDEEIGSVDEQGWFGRFDGPVWPSGGELIELIEPFDVDQQEELSKCAGAIVSENSNGDVYAEAYATPEALKIAWDGIESLYAAEWEVLVGNIGTVYTGKDEDEARKHFETYCEQSESGVGRASNEPVTLMFNGEIEDAKSQRSGDGN